jgi:hypothetical protein
MHALGGGTEAIEMQDRQGRQQAGDSEDEKERERRIGATSLAFRANEESKAKKGNAEKTEKIDGSLMEPWRAKLRGSWQPLGTFHRQCPVY